MKVSESGTSSIDASWPPEPGSNDRIRGFYDQPLDDSTLEEFTTAYEEACQVMNEEDVSRVTLRAVGEPSMVRELEERGVTVEAAMPLYGAPYQGLHLIYAGSNASERQATEDELKTHTAVIDEAKAKHEARGVNTQATPAELSAEVFQGHPDGIDEATFEGLLELYGAFGLSPEQVEEIVTNPNNTIALLKAAQNKVVSTVLAEQARIPIVGQSRDLVIAEVTEAATLPERRGEGLYTLLSRILVSHVVSDTETPLNALYGESNLSSVGVIYAAAKNSRNFSHHDRTALASTNPYFGILPQNFKVHDGVDTRPYNDFALSYHPLG